LNSEINIGRILNLFKRDCTSAIVVLTFAMVSTLLISGTARAGFERREQGARPVGMGGAFMGIADNAWAAVFNPAGLAQVRSGEVSAFYSPQPFGLQELSLASFAFVQSTSLGSLGLSGNRFGFELYRELSGTISYANSYKENFSFGINITYNSLTIKNYGSASAIGVDVGLLATITPGFRWGFFATNVNAPTIGQAREKLPQMYASGLAYSPVQNLLVALDVVKDVRYPTVIKGGIEYRLVDVVNLRAGVGSNPTKFSSGIGIHYSLVSFDYAVTTHQELGLSHQFSVSVLFSALQ
jgi:hypothetical protein